MKRNAHGCMGSADEPSAADLTILAKLACALSRAGAALNARPAAATAPIEPYVKRRTGAGPGVSEAPGLRERYRATSV